MAITEAIPAELRQELLALCAAIPPPDVSAAGAAQRRLDQLTKPPGSLGMLEDLILRLAAITGAVCPTIAAPAVLVAAGDHGVVAEQISPYPQAVTGQMVLNFLSGGAAINALAANAGARVIVVAAGVAHDFPDHPDLVQLHCGAGTHNLRQRAAMTQAEAARILLQGAALIQRQHAAGLDLLALGEMGIGNTTVAACLTSAFTGAPAEQTTGRGTGLDDAGVIHKRAVVAAAIARVQPDPTDPLRILAELGGFELAVLTGAALAAAARRIPIVLDGYVATAAALVAAALAPAVQPYLIAGHRSAEPGHRIALAHLELHPILQLD